MRGSSCFAFSAVNVLFVNVVNITRGSMPREKKMIMSWENTFGAWSVVLVSRGLQQEVHTGAYQGEIAAMGEGSRSNTLPV